ncbi:MAG TPA: circularly permuted type 2 ATP-grasp protein [Solirubrobacterales bacterium]|jgi:carboxylate-amine ligase|nr:circularly permuted type 2 ATP-grasp protein [Solirubrobacterales bacterium]
MAAPLSRPGRERFGADAFDERRSAPAAYARLFDRFGVGSLLAERDRIDASLRDAGVSFAAAPFAVDVVPRIIAGEAWEAVERGLIQRIRALNAFIADVYGERRAIAAGVVPGRLIESADRYEPAVQGMGAAIAAPVAGPDLLRAPDGTFMVLEDNLRAPSGLAYLLAARRVLEPLARACGLAPRSLEPAPTALGAAIAAAAPAGVEQPRIVLVNDGPRSGAGFEHADLARRFGMSVAAPTDLHRRGERLLLGDEPVDVLYRRVDDERLTAADGSATALGELIAGPLRAGSLGCVNSPGSGIADDKAIHVYVEAIIGFYLGEEPLLRSVPGFDLGDPAQLERALPRLGELVVKPRSGFGGRGVTIGPLASAGELRAVADDVRRAPERFVAQEAVPLSTHPTVTADGVAGRHVDLRPYVITAGESVTVAAGGLSRFAPGEGEMIVNSGRGGGAKDTWIL